MFYGECAALLAAFLWAVSSVLFRRAGQAVPPLLLNLYKGSIAVVALTIALLFTGNSLLAVEFDTLAILLISGAIGIGIGDTAFFAALNQLGERKTVLIAETGAPVFAFGLGLLLLGETLPILGLAGVVLTLLGIGTVIGSGRQVESTGKSWTGYLPALLAAGCQALGVVLTREAYARSPIGALESSLLRILGGLVVVAVLLATRRQILVPQKLREKPTAAYPILVATLLGTVLGIVLQQTALKFTSAVVAQTLIATSVLFVIPFSILAGERPSFQACMGAGLALAGVTMIISA